MYRQKNLDSIDVFAKNIIETLERIEETEDNKAHLELIKVNAINIIDSVKLHEILDF